MSKGLDTCLAVGRGQPTTPFFKSVLPGLFVHFVQGLFSCKVYKLSWIRARTSMFLAALSAEPHGHQTVESFSVLRGKQTNKKSKPKPSVYLYTDSSLGGKGGLLLAAKSWKEYDLNWHWAVILAASLFVCNPGVFSIIQQSSGLMRDAAIVLPLHFLLRQSSTPCWCQKEIVYSFWVLTEELLFLINSLKRNKTSIIDKSLTRFRHLGSHTVALQ